MIVQKKEVQAQHSKEIPAINTIKRGEGDGNEQSLQTKLKSTYDDIYYARRADFILLLEGNAGAPSQRGVLLLLVGRVIKLLSLERTDENCRNSSAVADGAAVSYAPPVTVPDMVVHVAEMVVQVPVQAVIVPPPSALSPLPLIKKINFYAQNSLFLIGTMLIYTSVSTTNPTSISSSLLNDKVIKDIPDRPIVTSVEMIA
uniref:Uncharacterized protein n=1 Tax=Glossina brevipalpis TaxID=37001 RepID=A0A1A9WI01_9MUSC